MGWQEKAWNFISGGKSLCSSATGDFVRPRTRPGLAVALALVLATLVLSIAIPYARAADPGHPASAISGSTFDTGDFIFPTNLTVNKFFIANGTTLFVDAINGRVGIGTASPSTKLDVNGSLNITDASGRIRTPELCLTADSCRTTWPTGGAGWAASGNYVYNDTAAAKVGIGTATPQQKLDVIGTVNATDYICTGGSDCIGATEINSTSLASECSTITGSAGLCDGLDDTCSNSACTVGSDDTLTNPTVGGALSMANYPISNIGSTDTDFTSDGGLTLHGNFSVLGTGTQTIAGNTSFDGGTLYVDSNNDRVGIGTTGPLAKLHVASDDAKKEVSIGDDIWTLDDSLTTVTIGNSDYNSRLRMGQSTTAYGALIWAYDATEANTYFKIQSTPTTNKGLILQADGGSVGIGTASPSKKLEVSNSTQGITFDPTVINPVINTTANNLTITSAGGNVIIQLG